MARSGVPTQLRWLVAGTLGFAAVVLGYGVWDRGQRGPIVISTDPTLVTIVVEIRGAVAAPGVYTLPEDGRVGQLVEMAGGVTADADLRQLNLARRLTDEELIVVPSMTAAGTVASPISSSAASVPSGGLLNINAATAAELEALPGIGEVLAARIVDHREVNGPFRRIEDLAEVDGISEGLVDDLRDLIAVGP